MHLKSCAAQPHAGGQVTAPDQSFGASMIVRSMPVCALWLLSSPYRSKRHPWKRWEYTGHLWWTCSSAAELCATLRQASSLDSGGCGSSSEVSTRQLWASIQSVQVLPPHHTTQAHEPSVISMYIHARTFSRKHDVTQKSPADRIQVQTIRDQ